jgi:DNA-binding transcriptional ArsR family regulator
MSNPVVVATIAELLSLVREAGSGELSVDELAKALLDIAIATGVAPALLSEHLTEAGRRRAEAIADIAMEAKIRIRELKGEG